MNKRYLGKVIYWFHNYGFVECLELKQSLFFHISDVSFGEMKSVSLLDEVSFLTSVTERGEHKGKLKASKINIIAKGDLSSISSRRIGTVYDWNGRYGFIKYPTDGKKILLYKTRALYDNNVKEGDVIVFNPVNSNRDKTYLFAQFAYPIKFETDIEFIITQYQAHSTPELKCYILNISKKSKELTTEQRFELDLICLDLITDNESYMNLVKLIKKYKAEYYHPSHTLLSKYIPDENNVYLIQLWESDIIDSYDLDVITNYFLRSNADKKRMIADRVSVEDKSAILNEYYEKLLETGRFNRLNNELKLLLNIINPNAKTDTPYLYEKVKEQLKSYLKPEAIIDLWLHDYLPDLDEEFIINNIDSKDFKTINILLNKKENDKASRAGEVLRKIYQKYFNEIINEGIFDFDNEYPVFIKYLQIYKKQFEIDFNKIIVDLSDILEPYHKFVLWLYGVTVEFDPLKYILTTTDKIDHYFKLKFVLSYSEHFDVELSDLLDKIYIDEDGLLDFSTTFKWNDLVYPTKREGKEETTSFLSDIATYNEKVNKDIDIRNLAEEIYKAVKLDDGIKLRLWLYSFTGEYDYIGFRESYKSLTAEEQKLFRNKANDINVEEQEQIEALEVINCVKCKVHENGITTYYAHLENIYFSNEYIRLRKKDGKYTEPLYELFSSTGLNRLPSNHSFNEILIEIDVKENDIVEIRGLDILFSKIHTGEISKALGSLKEPLGVLSPKNSPYVEDWKLRKQIIDYLNENQTENSESIIVNEPKNFYRRMDENSGIDSYEKTGLYSIEIENEYIIVWENIDLTFDRATYVFKCFANNYKSQIDKIKEAIGSYAQFRSSLLSMKDEKFSQHFKNNFGFIVSIRKQRGKKESFSNWVSKLEKAMYEPIPDLPSEEQLKELNRYISTTPLSVSTKRVSHKIAPVIIGDKLPTVDIYEGGTSISNKIKKSNYKSSNKESLLKSLKEFNQYFMENLNIN